MNTSNLPSKPLRPEGLRRDLKSAVLHLSDVPCVESLLFVFHSVLVYVKTFVKKHFWEKVFFWFRHFAKTLWPNQKRKYIFLNINIFVLLPLWCVCLHKYLEVTREKLLSVFTFRRQPDQILLLNMWYVKLKLYFPASTRKRECKVVSFFLIYRWLLIKHNILYILIIIIYILTFPAPQIM